MFYVLNAVVIFTVFAAFFVMEVEDVLGDVEEWYDYECKFLSDRIDFESAVLLTIMLILTISMDVLFIVFK